MISSHVTQKHSVTNNSAEVVIHVRSNSQRNSLFFLDVLTGQINYNISINYQVFAEILLPHSDTHFRRNLMFIDTDMNALIYPFTKES